jgi:putative tryptophan/tyrosine transport system substrate-binding protein
MKRREFMILLGGAMTAARPAPAQQRATPVIGWLSALSPAIQGGSRMPELGTFGSVPENAWTPLAAFAKGLSETGYVEGQNVAIEYRWAEGHPDRLPALAADLVAQKVDVIVAVAGTAPARAAKRATSTIPIVFTSVGDPIESGLVASLARPGGNLTGFVFSPADLDPKRLELLSELVPQAEIIGLLVHPSEQNSPPFERYTREMQDAARAKGVQLLVLEARSENEIDTAFASLVRLHVGALVVASDPFFTQRNEQLVALAAHYAVPATYHLRGFVTAGGLISYGSPFRDLYRGAGAYVGRILAGAKPADLPVQQASTYELVVNLKTAEALGLAVPPSILARADEVIE